MAVTFAQSSAYGAPGDGVVSADAPESPGQAKPEQPRKIGVLSSAFLVVVAGLDIGGRELEYDGDMASDNLPPYDVDGVPALYLGVELYPLSADPDSLLAKFGVDASFTRTAGLVSTGASESGTFDVDAGWTQVTVGARIRHAVAGALISAGVGYGASVFEFEEPPPEITDVLPDASYRFARIGADGRIGHGPFAVFGGADLLLVGKPGGVADRFRQASATGFGARAGIAVRVTRHFETRGVARYRRFNARYTAAQGDEFVADTSTDDQYNVLIGVAFVY